MTPRASAPLYQMGGKMIDFLASFLGALIAIAIFDALRR